MGFIPYSVFEEQWNSGDSDLRYNVCSALNTHDVDSSSAMDAYNQLREFVVDRGSFYGKALRPWNVNPALTSGMDRSQAWWGWEFETGYNNRPARKEVIQYVWDNWDNVAFDEEGDGSFVSEITFSPAEISKFRDGSAPALQFMRYIAGKTGLILLSNNPADARASTYCGTHLNISIPEVTNIDQANAMARMLSVSIASLPTQCSDDGDLNTRECLFGRGRLYGLVYARGSGPGSVWMECKVFRTTYHSDTFDQYLKTAEGLTKAAQSLVPYVHELIELESVRANATSYQALADWTEQTSQDGAHYIGNLYEVITYGAVPEISKMIGSHIVGGAVQYGTSEQLTQRSVTAEFMEYLQYLRQQERNDYKLFTL
jgi:hypothetical protein